MITRRAALLISLMLVALPLLAQIETPSRITRVENGLIAAVPIKGETAWTIQERMAFYHAPGVSVAVIDSFRVVWAKGYGVKDAGAKAPVTPQTLFQAASISKPVNATALLFEVEKGKLALDVNVNRYLTSWKLPENALTGKKEVTLTNLLSHTGGTTVSGFPGYAPTVPIPTVQQVLNGVPPANTRPIIVDLEPGQRFRYSGGGITITQLVLTELEGKPYPQILKELVLDPIGMTSSTFLQPLPESRMAEASIAHGPDGMPSPDRYHVYPEMAAAGLWTTPTDLARFAIEHQLSLQGKSNRILSQGMEEKMMTPYISEGYGLGFGIEKRGDAVYFQHSGGNYGFNCLLIAHKEKGYGAVVMVNANAYGIIPEIIRSIAKEYDWEDYVPEPLVPAQLSQEALLRLTGRYLAGKDEVVRVWEEAGKLFAEATSSERIEIIPLSNTEVVRKDVGLHVILRKGDVPWHDTLAMNTNSGIIAAPRLRDDHLVPIELLRGGNVEEAVRQYREIRGSAPSDQAIAESRINQIGYTLLGDGKVDAAIAIFTLNVEFNPESWNVYDSLGEALAKKGEKDAAIKNYEHALRLNPSADSAKKGLESLKK